MLTLQTKEVITSILLNDNIILYRSIFFDIKIAGRIISTGPDEADL